MSQIITKGIANNAVIETKIRLSNEGWLKARNQANTADVNIVKLDANNETVFASQATRFTGNVIIANNQYFEARNQADSADIPLLRLTSANEVEFGKSDNVSYLVGIRTDTVSAGQVNLYTGNAQVNILPNGGGAPAVRWHDDDASNYVGLKAPGTVSASLIFTLMGADGTAGQAIVTDGALGLSFATVGGGGSGMAPTAADAAYNVNTNISNPGTATFDGVTLTTGKVLFLWGQSAPAQNGPYIFDTSSTPLVRHSDWDTAADFKSGRLVFIRSGDVYAYTQFGLLQDVVTLGTTAVSFVLTSFDNASVPTGLIPAIDNNSSVGTGSKQFADGQIRILNTNNFVAIDGAMTLDAKGFGLSGYTQDETGGSNSASVLFKSGDVVNGLSGDLTMRVGIETGAGTRGVMRMEMRRLRIYGEVSDQGNEKIILGREDGETASTGFQIETADGTVGANNSQALNIFSGTSGSGNSGGLNFGTGVAGANSGSISIATGSVSTGTSGVLDVRTGDVTGANSSGTIAIASGQSTVGDGASGSVSLISGNTTGAGDSGSATLQSGSTTGAANSGQVLLESGNVNNATAVSGAIQLVGGNNPLGATGQINLIVGTAATPDDAGIIQLTAYRTVLTSGVLGLYSVATDPADLTSYNGGDTYYNNTSNKPKYFNGTTWEYFDGGVSASWGKEYVTLSGTDITNQYFDLAQSARLNSVSALAKGQPMGIENAAEDYTLSYTGGVAGVTRLNFVTNWATAGVSELQAGDILVIQYQY